MVSPEAAPWDRSCTTSIAGGRAIVVHNEWGFYLRG